MKYAGSILDIGRLPLRRRDAEAMRLALSCLRRDGHIGGARTVLARGGAVACQVSEETWGLAVHVSLLVLRARLALLLRTLLRVDAGDYGPWLWWPEEMIADSTCGEFGGVRPLWQDAPGGQR